MKFKGDHDHRYSLKSVSKNWKLLDDETCPKIEGIRLISHEEFTSSPEIKVEQIRINFLTHILKSVPLLYWLLYSIKLLSKADKQTVVIIDGGNPFLWAICGILNAMPFLGGKMLLCRDLFAEFVLQKNVTTNGSIKNISRKCKEKAARFIIGNYGLNVLWSKKQVKTHATMLRISEDSFIFLPYKANQSINT